MPYVWSNFTPEHLTGVHGHLISEGKSLNNLLDKAQERSTSMGRQAVRAAAREGVGAVRQTEAYKGYQKTLDPASTFMTVGLAVGASIYARSITKEAKMFRETYETEMQELLNNNKQGFANVAKVDPGQAAFSRAKMVKADGSVVAQTSLPGGLPAKNTAIKARYEKTFSSKKIINNTATFVNARSKKDKQVTTYRQNPAGCLRNAKKLERQCIAYECLRRDELAASAGQSSPTRQYKDMKGNNITNKRTIRKLDRQYNRLQNKRQLL